MSVMSFTNELFQCCKKGDLKRVKYLVLKKEVELNVRDKWDSTPLYYACLCGHTKLVHYLLKYGARCEVNTFDGERCVYGALTIQIRDILLQNKVLTSKIIRRNHYDEFLRKSVVSGDYFDIIFSVHKQIFKAHRSVLSVRCEYFKDMFTNKWRNRKIVYINNFRVNPIAFRILLYYIYTGRLETQLDLIDDVKLLVKQCRIHQLLEQIDDAVKKIKSFECTKPGTNVTTILVETDSYGNDFNILVQQAIPRNLHHWISGEELPFLPNFSDNYFYDIMFKIEGNYFRCHKLFFCGRSDYFKALINDHFLEAEEQVEGVQVFEMKAISLDAFIGLLSFLYQNQAEFTPKNVYELLYASDIYLLPGLKMLCANYIGRRLDTDNVISVLYMTRLMQLPKLELICTEFMAKNLEYIISKDEFCNLIIEDAREVRGRQETDTITIIDDIRYHITSNVQAFSAMSEVNDKLALIDGLLERLGLDA